MKGHDKNKQVKRKDNHLQIELTATTLDNNETNEQPHVLRKDANTQTKRIKSKNVRVQTEQTALKFDDEYTNNQRHSLRKDVEIKNDSLHKVNGKEIHGNQQVTVRMPDSHEARGASMTKNRRIVEADTEKQNLRTTNIIKNIKPDLGPIIGYAEEPLLPLYKACAPLIPIIHNLSFYVQLALDETPDHPPDGLTIDESAAIRLYTIEWEGSHRSLYSMLNHTLKKDTRENLRPYYRYLKLFLTALVKLPCVPHLTVWRGVTKDLSSEFLPGAQITWWPFSSCTTEMTVLESNIYLGTSGSRTLFSVEAINGRTIRAHSHFVTEDEILLLPGTHMIVQSKFSPATDLHIIHLKQIQPEVILLEPPFENAHIYPKIERHWYLKKRFGIPMCIFIVLIIAGIIIGSVLRARSKMNVTQTGCQNPFGNSSSYTIGKNPAYALVVQLGRGQRSGVVVANSGDNTVRLIVSNGNGTFQTSGTYTVGRTPDSMVSADFNNDGITDLAVANADNNTVSVLLGIENGTFYLLASYMVGHAPYSLTANDFNGDTNPDLAVVNYADNTVSMLIGSGNGTFYLLASYTVGNGPYSVTSDDFNNDKYQDLAVANYADNTVSILYGNGNGTFKTLMNVSVGKSPTCVTTAPLNNGDNTNLVVVNSGDNNVCFLFINTNGTFQNSGCYAAGPGPYSVIFADFNSDSKQDLAVANKANNTISVLLSSGNTTFQTPIFYQVESKPTSLVAAHFNNDNQMDLMVTNEGSDDLSIFLNVCVNV